MITKIARLFCRIYCRGNLLCDYSLLSLEGAFGVLFLDLFLPWPLRSSIIFSFLESLPTSTSFFFIPLSLSSTSPCYFTCACVRLGSSSSLSPSSLSFFLVLLLSLLLFLRNLFSLYLPFLLLLVSPIPSLFTLLFIFVS